MARCAHERASGAVPSPHSALHAGRDRARVGGDRWSTPRPIGGRELSLLERLDGQVEHPLKHLGEIAAQDPMAEQGLRMMELLLSTLADGESKQETLGGDRSHL